MKLKDILKANPSEKKEGKSRKMKNELTLLLEKYETLKQEHEQLLNKLEQLDKETESLKENYIRLQKKILSMTVAQEKQRAARVKKS